MVLRNAEITHAAAQRHFTEGFDLQHRDGDYLCVCLFGTQLNLRQTSYQCSFHSNNPLFSKFMAPCRTFSADNSTNLNTDFAFLKLGKPSNPIRSL